MARFPRRPDRLVSPQVEAGGATYYFKALPDAARAEHAVTEFLAKNFPHSVPRLVAMDADRRWLLLAACAGRNLETVDDIVLWSRAARRYGELQVACASRSAQLDRVCPRRELESLPAAVAALAADEGAVRLGEADGLTRGMGATARARVESR